jgi:hypothetical protein
VPVRSATIPHEKRKREKWDEGRYSKAHASPFETLANPSAYSWDAPRRSLEVCVGNPLGNENSVLEDEAFVANLGDNTGAHFSVWQFAVDEVVLVDAQLSNHFSIGDFFLGEWEDWPWKPTACTRLRILRGRGWTELRYQSKLLGCEPRRKSSNFFRCRLGMSKSGNEENRE